MKKMLYLVAGLLVLIVLGAAQVSVNAGSCNPATPSPQTDVFACACAQNPDATSGSLPCKVSGEDPVGGPNGVFAKVERVIAFIAGVAAVFIVVISGLQIILANGDSQKVAKSRNSLIYALVGIAIIAVAHGIVVFVINRIK